jgi:hypothetical protein
MRTAAARLQEPEGVTANTLGRAPSISQQEPNEVLGRSGGSRLVPTPAVPGPTECRSFLRVRPEVASAAASRGARRSRAIRPGARCPRWNRCPGKRARVMGRLRDGHGLTLTRFQVVQPVIGADGLRVKRRGCAEIRLSGTRNTRCARRANHLASESRTRTYPCDDGYADRSRKAFAHSVSSPFYRFSCAGRDKQAPGSASNRGRFRSVRVHPPPFGDSFRFEF